MNAYKPYKILADFKWVNKVTQHYKLLDFFFNFFSVEFQGHSVKRTPAVCLLNKNLHF